MWLGITQSGEEGGGRVNSLSVKLHQPPSPAFLAGCRNTKTVSSSLPWAPLEVELEQVQADD